MTTIHHRELVGLLGAVLLQCGGEVRVPREIIDGLSEDLTIETRVDDENGILIVSAHQHRRAPG